MNRQELLRDACILIVPIDDLSDKQHEDIRSLQQQCFANVPGQEIEEDFFTSPIARVLCYYQERLVGCAGTRIRRIEYEGESIILGGISGVCTGEEMRGLGLATAVCRKAMVYLAKAGCDIVFLSTSEMARGLYAKLGFRPIKAGFSWENIYGTVKTGANGLIAPLQSSAIAGRVINGDTVFHVGKGYW